MRVSFTEGHIKGFHKTGYVSLTDIFKVGNRHRIINNRSAANITDFINSAKTNEFMNIIADKQGIDASEIVIKQGRGKSSRTFCSLHLAIYAAEYLSPEFHYEVVDKFIEGQLFLNRDNSGDQFSILNIVVDNYLPGRELKTSNKGIYIQIAKMIKAGISPDENDWNTATAEQLKTRTEVEKQIAGVLRLNLVRDWEHLKQLIADILKTT